MANFGSSPRMYDDEGNPLDPQNDTPMPDRWDGGSTSFSMTRAIDGQQQGWGKYCAEHGVVDSCRTGEEW